MNAQHNRIRSDNTSGFKGVSWHPSGRWRACIKQDGRNVHLGLYDTAQDAANAYDSAAVVVYGADAWTNARARRRTA